jgi:galactose-1-phosphate uridylyltransferase
VAASFIVTQHFMPEKKNNLARLVKLQTEKQDRNRTLKQLSKFLTIIPKCLVLKNWPLLIFIYSAEKVSTADILTLSRLQCITLRLMVICELYCLKFKNSKV